MSIILEVWEDSGPVLTGHGTLRQSVSNVGHKSSPTDETFPWVDYPIIRPSFGSFNETENMALSYHKYTYFKIQGTYPAGAVVRVKLEGDLEGVGNGFGVASGVRLLYKWTNVYQEPTNEMLKGSTALVDGRNIFIPMLSTVGPQDATSLVNQMVTDTTYYTQYLVTQLQIDPGALDNFGNIDLLTVKLSLHEYESTDI